MRPKGQGRSGPRADIDDQAFLEAGGEMGRLTRDHDWASSSLGPPGGWPQSLKTAVRLVLTSRHPMFIWWGPELIQFYNDAYSETMGPERHPSALGARGRECWAEIWPVIGPQIEMVMAGEGSTWHEDQLIPVTRHGALREVWWTYGYSPIDDAEGVGGVLVVCKDVTEEHLAREALARANERLTGDFDRLLGLFEQAPGFMAVLRGPDHVFEFTNAAYERLVARGDLLGHPVRAILPEVEGQGFIDLLDGVYRTGRPHVGSGMPIVLAGEDGAAARTRYLDFVYQPIRNAAEQVSGIFVEGYDVTARVEAEGRQQLFAEEMNHRVKNTLATVQSLVLLAGKAGRSVADFQAILADRIQAMAKTQDLLVHGHAHALEVREVLKTELAPYLGIGDKVSFHCDAMVIEQRAAVSLGLIVHELLTNAAKYGALSTPDGELFVRCEATPDGAVLTWREKLVAGLDPAAARKGFGSRLIEKLAQALSGRADIQLAPAGLTATVTFRLDAQA